MDWLDFDQSTRRDLAQVDFAVDFVPDRPFLSISNVVKFPLSVTLYPDFRSRFRGWVKHRRTCWVAASTCNEQRVSPLPHRAYNGIGVH